MNAVVAFAAVLAVVGATHVKREVVSYVPAVSYVAPNPVLARASRILGEPGFVSRYVAAPVAAPVAAVETLDARYVAAPAAAQYVAAPVAARYVAAAPAAQYVAAAPVETVAVAAPAKLVSPVATSYASSSVVNSGPALVAAAPARYSVLV